MLAEQSELQLISIATESGIHTQIALDCIDATGCHLLCMGCL